MPNTRKKGQTGHYRNSLFPDFHTVDQNPGFPKTTCEPHPLGRRSTDRIPLTGRSNTDEIFNHGLSKAYHKPCLGHRPLNPTTGDFEPFLVWQTYKQIDDRRTAFGSGLIKLQQDGVVGSNEKTGWSLGLWTHNRPGAYRLSGSQ